MRGVTESVLFSGFWKYVLYNLAPWHFIPEFLYSLFYNTNEWKFDPNNPATFKGTWDSSQYTILEYNPFGLVVSYICQPVLFGMMKFEEVIVMSGGYDDPDTLAREVFSTLAP